jgi:hypothetical protein
MQYKVLINGQTYPVTGFRSFHVSDTPRSKFADVSKEEHPNRTMIEIELPDRQVGVIPIPTPIQDVIEYFQMLDDEGEIFKADGFYKQVDAKPKPNLYDMMGVIPT